MFIKFINLKKKAELEKEDFGRDHWMWIYGTISAIDIAGALETLLHYFIP